jgi:hypothetical protein
MTRVVTLHVGLRHRQMPQASCMRMIAVDTGLETAWPFANSLSSTSRCCCAGPGAPAGQEEHATRLVLRMAAAAAGPAAAGVCCVRRAGHPGTI